MEPDSTQEAQILQCVERGDFSGLVVSCNDLELILQEEILETLSPEQIDRFGLLYAVHLLAHLLEGHLNAARVLWKRILPSVQQHAQVIIVHDLLTARLRGEHAEFFKLIQSNPWEAQLQPLVSEVISRSRDQLLDRIGEAYKVITIDRVAMMLGLDGAGASAACNARGWALDGMGEVTPIQMKAAEDLIQMGDAPLKKLAEYVAYLEQPCRT